MVNDQPVSAWIGALTWTTSRRAGYTAVLGQPLHYRCLRSLA